MNNEASMFYNSIHQNSNPNFHQQKNYLFSHTFSKFMLFIQPKPFVKLQEEEILFSQMILNCKLIWKDCESFLLKLIHAELSIVSAYVQNMDFGCLIIKKNIGSFFIK